jgi:cholesterol transport system auxiliary component
MNCFSQIVARRIFILGTCASFLLSGCGLSDLGEIIGPPPPPQIYVLKPATGPALPGPQLPWQLSVAVPDAPASIDTIRIALNPTPSTLDYYADAAWPDRIPVLIQSHLIEAFESANRVAVARDTDGLMADYLLRTELRDFQAHYAGGSAPLPDQPALPPEITVRLDARLVAVQERRVVENISVVHSASARTNDMDGIVAAFDEALGAALAEIVSWTLNTPPEA